MTGLFGGAFNPPHLGHLELARRALEEFDLDRLQILVSGDPGHKSVECPVEERVALAKLAFADLPRTVVRADPYRYTIDLLRAEQPEDAIFLMGADQYRDFSSWKEPVAVLDRVQLGVATRAGVQPPPILPEHSGRVRFFEIDSPLEFVPPYNPELPPPFAGGSSEAAASESASGSGLAVSPLISASCDAFRARTSGVRIPASSCCSGVRNFLPIQRKM